jgi:NADPH:quinone reductase-like Zn-dependent oxidoreductase
MTTTNRAAVFPGPRKLLEVDDVQAFHPGTGEVLIRNHAVALQPLDAKMLISGYGPSATLQYPAVLGTSGAGVVEELGEGVSGLQIGDRVVFDTKAYVKPDENRKQGTWQQLVICDASTVAKVIFGTFRVTRRILTHCKIGGVSFEQAVLVSFPLQTAVAALHVFLGMGLPGSGSMDEKVLIWGAGGAVGSYAVQYAKSVSLITNARLHILRQALTFARLD